MKERTKSTVAVIIISLFILMAGYIEVHAYAGQLCNWQSDCGFNETCQTVPFHQRDSNTYSGICVPK